MKCPACKEGTLKIGVYQVKSGAYRKALNKGTLSKENFSNRNCRWHWARIAGGKTIKICTSCSSKRGLPVPFMADIFYTEVTA